MSSSLTKHALVYCFAVIGLAPGPAICAEPLDVWHWRNPLPQGNGLVGVTYGKGKYVAVAPRDTVVSSTDGESWCWQRFGSRAWLTGVAFEGETFFGLGDGIWSSGDGNEWVRRSDHFVWALAQGSGQYVGVGWMGTIVTSPDGVGWVERDSGTDEGLNGIAYADGRFVAVGGYYTNGVILVSGDGIWWTNRTVSTDILNGVAWGNGRFVAVGYSWNGGEDVSLVSSNGMDWVRHARKPEDYFWSVCYGQGVFVAVDSRRVATSVDGVAWTERYVEPDRNGLYEVKWLNGRFVAVGNAGAIVTSEDGIHWTRRTVGTASAFRGLAFGNDRIVAVSDGGVVLSSDGGGSWRQDRTERVYLGLTFGNGLFVASGRLGANAAVFRSTDGREWSAERLETEAWLGDITWTGGGFVMLGWDGNRGTNEVFVSGDGKDWSRRPVPARGVLNGLTFGGERLVAVGAEGTILVSTDLGTNWSLQASGTTNSLNAVGYGDGLFVTGDSYGNLLTSTNGQDWRRIGINNYNVLWGVGYGNGTYLAVGGDGVLSSTNGVDWSYRMCPSMMALREVIYAHGRFVVAGERGALLQSGYCGRPELTGPHLEAGGFGFWAQGEAGRSYRVEKGSEIGSEEWEILEVFTAGEEARLVVDPVGSGPGRFYRLRGVE